MFNGEADTVDGVTATVASLALPAVDGTLVRVDVEITCDDTGVGVYKGTLSKTALALRTAGAWAIIGTPADGPITGDGTLTSAVAVAFDFSGDTIRTRGTGAVTFSIHWKQVFGCARW